MLAGTYSGRTEAFPATTGIVAEVAKALLKDTTPPPFGLPGPLQSNDAPAFVSSYCPGHKKGPALSLETPEETGSIRP